MIMTPWVTPHLTGLATNSDFFHVNEGLGDSAEHHVSKAEQALLHWCVGGGWGLATCLVARQAVEFP